MYENLLPLHLYLHHIFNNIPEYFYIKKESDKKEKCKEINNLDNTILYDNKNDIDEEEYNKEKKQISKYI